MRKIIVVIISLMLVLTLSISAFAACPYCEKVIFDHEPIEGGWEAVDDEEHGATFRFEYYCDVCGNTESGHEYITRPHRMTLTNATCNGIKQTHYYKCTLCNYKYEETINCPDRDHSDGCNMLPMSIDDGREIY